MHHHAQLGWFFCVVLTVLCETISRCPSPSKAFEVLWDLMGGAYRRSNYFLFIIPWSLLLTAQRKLEKLAIVLCPGV